VPVVGTVGELLICNFNASAIRRSLDEDEMENDTAALAAWELFRLTAARDDLACRMMLEPGDLQFLNNRVVLHGRTAFADYAEIDRKRLMLRLWLMMPGWPAMTGETKWHDDGHRGGGFLKRQGAAG